MTGNLTPWSLPDGGLMRSPQLWPGDMEAPLPATAGSDFLPKARLQLCGHGNRRVGDSGARTDREHVRLLYEAARGTKISGA